MALDWLKEKYQLVGYRRKSREMGRCSSMNNVLVPLCFATLIVANLACSLPSERAAESMASTRAALDAEATTLALERARLTEEASALMEPLTLAATDTPEPEDTATPTQEVLDTSSGGVEGSLVREPGEI